MTITRENLGRGRVDLSDVTSGQKLPPIHPGETIRPAIEREIQPRAA